MDDMISRQAAIDVLKGLPTWWADEGGYYGGAQPPMVALLEPEHAVSAIEELPSAQPEIIRCKDCKYWRDDHTCHEHSLVSPMCANEYCSRAERRAERENDGHID